VWRFKEPSGPTTVRAERPGDAAAIRRVNQEAFGRASEADLVDALRAHGRVSLSLVAERDGAIVGHILFSPVRIDSGRESTAALGLAPMAVLPAHRRVGIGSALVRTGLGECRHAGHGCIVVLGHPKYYPRFGFVPASRHGLAWEHPAPDEAFMVLPLREGGIPAEGGLVRYAPEFG
jgi:putative acetyltransferase